MLVPKFREKSDPPLYNATGRGGILDSVVTRLAVNYPFTSVKLRYYKYRFTRGSAPPPFGIYAVDPNTITRYLEWEQFRTFPYAGRILSGDWDRAADPLSSLDKYSLIRRYFANEIESDELTRECLLAHGYPEVEAEPYTEYGYGDYLDELYQSLKDNGVLSQEVMTDDDRKRDRYDYVAINIGRDGELIFAANGCHRFTVARLLELETIPVRVNAIHGKWHEKYGNPESHPKLSHRYDLSIPWRDLYRLDVHESEISHGPEVS